MVLRVCSPGRPAKNRGGKMLPAVSADLPAYLAPPVGVPEGRRTATTESAFGPSAQVDLSPEKAVDAQSRNPGTGLYGPDGRFVESSARRDQPASDNASRQRDLALAQIEAIVPPAAREELRALADRVGRLAARQQYDPGELKKIAHLMTKVGRYDEAQRALKKAQQLETPGAAASEEESPSALDAAPTTASPTEAASD